jgi:hypothetical protein
VRAPWPNLFLVGAPRCGTTSLFTYLAAHPDVFGPVEKEPHYYDRDVLGLGGLDQDEYAAMFAGSASKRWRIDASTLYLYSPGAPAAIERDSPDAHVVISVRDPVELVASWHRLLVASGAETQIDLAAALDAGMQPLLPYLEVGAFAEHVARWREAFGPDRVHVVRLETLDATCAQLVRSLGLEPVEGQELPHLNPARRTAGVASLINRPTPLRTAVRMLLPQRARRAVWHRVNRALTPSAEREPVDRELRERLEPLFSAERELLASTA